MTRDNWITIIVAIVQTVIAIIAIGFTWYIGRRQIQIMLQQAIPTDKPPKKQIVPYLLLALCLILICFSVLSVILHFIAYDLTTRSQSLTLVINILGFVFYNFVAREVVDYIRAAKRKA